MLDILSDAPKAFAQAVTENFLDGFIYMSTVPNLHGVSDYKHPGGKKCEHSNFFPFLQQHNNVIEIF